MSGGAYVLHSHSRGGGQGVLPSPTPFLLFHTPLLPFPTPLFPFFLPCSSPFSQQPSPFSHLLFPFSHPFSPFSHLLSLFSHPPSPSTLSAPYIRLRDCSHKNQFLLGRFAQTDFFFTWTINPGRFAQMVKMWNKKFLIENFKLQ